MMRTGTVDDNPQPARSQLYTPTSVYLQYLVHRRKIMFSSALRQSITMEPKSSTPQLSSLSLDPLKAVKLRALELALRCFAEALGGFRIKSSGVFCGL